MTSVTRSTAYFDQ